MPKFGAHAHGYKSETESRSEKTVGELRKLKMQRNNKQINLNVNTANNNQKRLSTESVKKKIRRLHIVIDSPHVIDAVPGKRSSSSS